MKMVNAMRGLLKLYRDTMSKIEDITSRCMTSVCVCVSVSLCVAPPSLHRTQSDISLQWSAQTKLRFLMSSVNGVLFLIDKGLSIL